MTRQRAVFYKIDILLLIFFFIGCQQFPIVRIGGPIRVYELLGLLLLVRYGIQKPKDMVTWGMFIMFVLSPILSYLHSWFVDIPISYYRRYPEAVDSFKFGGRTYSCFQMLFSIVSYCVACNIVYSKNLWVRFDKWIRTLIKIGVVISIIGLIDAFVFNPIAMLPSFVQNVGEYKGRNNGLFLEPSMYVLYQTWMVLFSYVYRKKFKGNHGKIFLWINAISLLATLSSSLAAFAVVLLSMPFVFKASIKTRLSIIFGLAAFVLMIIVVAEQLGLSDTLQYVLYYKIENFFTPADHTMDSGAFRNFTSRVGLEIFKDHPLLGVGVGNSPFFMHLYEGKMGIVTWGEGLSMSTMPQSFYACLLAEQGILGGLGFSLLLIGTIHKVWKYRNCGNLGKIFYLGVLVNFGVLFTVPIIYSMYLWVFMALALSYYQFISKIKYYANCNRLPNVG